MEYKNTTEKNIINHLRSSVHIWDHIKDTALKVKLVHTENTAYAIFVNNSFTGSFINDTFVNPEEAKALGWVVKGKPIAELQAERALTKAELKKQKRKEHRMKRLEREQEMSNTQDPFETL